MFFYIYMYIYIVLQIPGGTLTARGSTLKVLQSSKEKDVIGVFSYCEGRVLIARGFGPCLDDRSQGTS